MVLLIILIAILFGYAFLTGFTDASNSITAPISSRVLTPKRAVVLAACFDFVGALTGTAVAATITRGFVDITDLTLGFVLAVMLATMSWSIITYYLGIPVSETHGLVGAMIGGGLAVGGASIIQWGTLIPIMVAIIVSPFLGFIVGFLITKLARIFGQFLSQRAGKQIFSIGQIITSASSAFAHGNNDGQKPMGIITMCLAIYVGDPLLDVPLWVKLVTATLVALGTYFGGFRIIKTIGLKLSKMDVVQGFTSQLSTTAVLELASSFGIPVSSTQIITSSIAGGSVAKNKNSLNWGLFGEIIISWAATLPVTLALGYGLTIVIVQLAGL